MLFAAAVTVAAMLGLAAAGLMMDPLRAQTVFSEVGAVERVTAWLWVLVGIAVLVLDRPPTAAALGGFVICILAAAREADWHKALNGESLLKPGFYLPDQSPAELQLLGAALVLMLVVAAVTVARRLLVLTRSLDHPWPAWAWGVMGVCAVLVVAKSLDRAPAILRDDFGITVPPRMLAVALAAEEGLEALTPLLVIAAVLGYRAARNHRDARTPDGPA